MPARVLACVQLMGARHSEIDALMRSVEASGHGARTAPPSGAIATGSWSGGPVMRLAIRSGRSPRGVRRAS